MSEPPPDGPVTPHDLAARCRAVDVLVMDVDGVLTDGVIAIDDRGVETKWFHVRDGWALAAWRKLGRRSAILSGRVSRAVDRRAGELRIDEVVQGASDKAEPFRALLARMGVDPSRVCYLGDDLPDLPVLRVVGLSVCPADAADEVRAAVHHVTRAQGGRGAVREAVELILKHQGIWDDLIAPLTAGSRADS